MYLKRIQEYVKKIKEGKEISVNENVVLLNTLQALQGKDIFRKNIDGRKQIVRSLIGTEQYKIIEKYYKEFFDKEDSSKKKLAMSILGPGLFSDSFIEKIKEYVFSNDSNLQYKAIWSLTYFGVDGMSALLSNFVFSGRLSPASRLAVLEALNDTNYPELEIVGLWIISHEKNASFVRIALENIEKTEAYLETIQTIFLSNRFPVANSKELSRGEDDDNNLNQYVLMSLYKHWEKVEDKDKLLLKITPMVENGHDGIYLYSAFIINKYGNDEQKELMKQVALKTEDKEKKQFLERVLAGKQE